MVCEVRRINIEPALRLGEELGGHIVTGHVDAVGQVAEMHAEGGSTHLAIHAPSAIAPFIAAKGSITLDGVRSEEHPSELQSLMRISYAVFCLKKTTNTKDTHILNISTKTQTII